MRVLLLTTLTCGIARALSAQTVATVEVTPAALSVEAGESAQFSVAVRDAAGRPVAEPVTWFATPFDIAASDSSGSVITTRAGRTYVFALAGGKVGMAELTIRERPATALRVDGPDTVVVGGTLVLTATGVTSVGDPVPTTDVDWRSSSRRIADVAEGTVQGVTPGRVTVTAREGTLEATHAIVVRPNPARSLSIAGPRILRAGDVGDFRVEATAAAGTRAGAAGVEWSVSGAGAQVTADGRFVANERGRYLLTATLGSVAATFPVEVRPRGDQRTLTWAGAARLPKGTQGAELWLSGNAAYLATIANVVYVYDVSDPTAPRLSDSLLVDARLINDVMLTADGAVGVLTREGASDRKNGLVLFDASTPLHPRIVGEYSATLTGGVHSAYIDGRYIYATSDATGSLRIIDIRDPRRPVEIGRYELPRDGVAAYDVEFLSISPQRYLHDVYVRDGLAYLAYWRDGLVILDVGKGIAGGSREHPVLVSHYNYNHAALYPPGFIAGTHAVWADERYVYLGDESYPGTADLNSPEQFPTRGLMQVIDVSDLAHPRKVAQYDPIEFGVHNLWVENGLMYIGGYNGGIRVLDVSGELLGDLRAQHRVAGSLYTGAIDGFRPNMALTWSAIPHAGYIFASDINTGLWVGKLVGEGTP